MLKTKKRTDRLTVTIIIVLAVISLLLLFCLVKANDKVIVIGWKEVLKIEKELKTCTIKQFLICLS